MMNGTTSVTYVLRNSLLFQCTFVAGGGYATSHGDLERWMFEGADLCGDECLWRWATMDADKAKGMAD